MDKIILLIEDDPDDRVLTLKALLKDLQHGTVIVRYGVEALDFLLDTADCSERHLSARPHLILLGRTLSQVSSLEVLRDIKGDARINTIPVVVLTSSNKEQDLLDSYSLGVNSIMRKPMDYLQFCEDIKRTIAYWFNLNQVPQGHNNTD